MSQIAKDVVDGALKAATDLSNLAVEELWKILIDKSEFFRQVSIFAAGFSGLFIIAFFIVQETNKKRSKDDQIDLVIDFKHYLIMGGILACLIAPDSVSGSLYGFHSLIQVEGSELVASLSSISGDPNVAFAQIQSANETAINGAKTCDAITSQTEQTKCQQDLATSLTSEKTGIEFADNAIQNLADGITSGNVVQAAQAGSELAADSGVLGPVPFLASKAAQSVGSSLGEASIVTLISPVLLAMGTGFLILLDIGQLTSTVMFPFVLLMGLYNSSIIAKWVKSFFSWGLISFAYKVIVTSIGFALLKGDVANTGLYAVIVGLISPWAAYQVVSGSSLGVLSAVGSTARTAFSLGR
jgi:hypothetical protein